MTIVRYRGNTYAGSILDEMTRHGETYIEVQIIGLPVSKWLHVTSIKQNVA